MLSRSMLGILLEVANGIDVPSAHISEGRAGATASVANAQDPHDRPMIRVLSGATPPAGPFAAVIIATRGTGSTMAILVQRVSSPS